MDLQTYAEQRLAGVPTRERGCYTRATEGVRRGAWWRDGVSHDPPSVERLREMADAEILEGTAYGFGIGSLGYLRELLGQ
jgi:hypothetical protein